ncbi:MULTISPECIES: hypothetical protein [Bremerella]|uniref:hypothetical protein n=1 Tax=Bremerella TaxID=2714594 RepID=UPI0031F0813E
MSFLKWTATVMLLFGATVVTVGCGKPAEPPVETPDAPEVTMPGDEKPADEAKPEEKPAEEPAAEEKPAE